MQQRGFGSYLLLKANEAQPSGGLERARLILKSEVVTPDH